MTASQATIDQEWPQGDPESFTCRHCGGYRQLTGTPARAGRRALVCPTCDAPDPANLTLR